MAKNNRVIWSEGLFLQPQHFQQQQRHLEQCIESRTRDHHAYCHGFSHLELDPDLLKAGKISILRASGYFKDGTPFNIPEQDPAPACIDIPVVERATLVSLCVHQPHWSGQHTAWQHPDDSTHRVRAKWLGDTIELPDISDAQAPTQAVDIGRLNTHFQVDEDALEGNLFLNVCRLLPEKGHVGKLDASFIEPCLCAIGNTRISRVLQATLALLQNKIDQLRLRRIRKGSHNSSEIGDFLLLQGCVQQRLAIKHLLGLKPVHPEAAYRSLLGCLGAVNLYGQDTAADFAPAYDHDDLEKTFTHVFEAIRSCLAGTHDQHATQIALSQKGAGIHVGQILDKALLNTAHFYLTVYAQAPEELVVRQFPSTVKIGPVEKLRDLVNLNLPGVRLKAVKQAPAALPYYADHIYFQLETRAEPLWKMLEQTGHLAIHHVGDLPELRFELWAVRREEDLLS